jgi:pyruvate/2-oxoglutarate dehydrogenase complex dihydrolipoamide acyltransferase (E2) component
MLVAMDRFNTPWRVTAAAIYTAPSDSRVYGSLDIDVTEAKRFMDAKRKAGVKITMVHLTTAVLARAVAFDVPELNCYIRRGSVVGRKRLNVMVPVMLDSQSGVSSVLVNDAHARPVSDLADDIRQQAQMSRGGKESKASQNKYLLNKIPWPFRRAVFKFLKWLTVDLGVEMRSLGLSSDSFGSFIVSDIGSFGLTSGMAALFPAAKIPAVIIMGKMEEKPVVRDGEVVIRTILPLTGTFDHRIVDGMQIGKLGRAIHRNFKKPEWLDEVPSEQLADCVFDSG